MHGWMDGMQWNKCRLLRAFQAIDLRKHGFDVSSGLGLPVHKDELEPFEDRLKCAKEPELKLGATPSLPACASSAARQNQRASQNKHLVMVCCTHSA